MPQGGNSNTLYACLCRLFTADRAACALAAISVNISGHAKAASTDRAPSISRINYTIRSPSILENECDHSILYQCKSRTGGDRTENSKGADSAPYWPAYTLAENERTGFQGGAYVLLIKTKEGSYSVSVPLAIWEKYHAGDQVTISVINGNIVSINDESVR